MDAREIIKHAGDGYPLTLEMTRELSFFLAENERLQKELTEWQNLKDPVCLHLNILRGILSLAKSQALHIAGATDYDFVVEENKVFRSKLDALREENERLKEEKRLLEKELQGAVTDMQGAMNERNEARQCEDSLRAQLAEWEETVAGWDRTAQNLLKREEIAEKQLAEAREECAKLLSSLPEGEWTIIDDNICIDGIPVFKSTGAYNYFCVTDKDVAEAERAIESLETFVVSAPSVVRSLLASMKTS